MANSADPDQLASEKPTDLDLHFLQRQGIFKFRRTGVKSGVVLTVKIEYGKCLKMSNINIPYILLLCSCFVKNLAGWQTV